jgi:ribosomal protein L7Ae-like RNA K-turn-binding protein
MDDAARRAVVRLVGLGARARNVVVGVDLLRAAAARGRVALIVLGADGSRHTRAKLLPLAQARGVGVIEGLSCRELGDAVGRGSVAAVGITDRALADGISAAAAAAVRGSRRNG